MSEPSAVIVDGAVVGHACTTCGHIRMADANIDESEYTSEDAARDHCRCGEEGCANISAKPGAQYCEFHYWLSSWRWAWRFIGYAVSLGVTNEVVWKVISDQLDYGHYMNELHALMERRTYEGCHCGPGCRYR